MGLKDLLGKFIPEAGLINSLKEKWNRRKANSIRREAIHRRAINWAANNKKVVAGGGIGVILIIIIFMLFSTLVAVIQLGFKNLALVSLAIGVIGLAVLAKKGHLMAGIFVLIISIFVWLFLVGYSDDISLYLEEKNILPKAEKELEESGVGHQFRLVGQLLTGDFDPEKLWTSEEVKSEYSEPEEFEIFLENIGPRKEYFESGEIIEIGGNINLISGFDKTTRVALSAEPKKICAEKMKKEGCSEGEWACFISGSEEKNIFDMERIYNRQFYCSHEGVKVKKEQVISDLSIFWEYTTSAVAGKQIYVFSQQASSMHQNLLSYYGIGKDTTASWYIGDNRINLGVGLERDREYILADDSSKYEGDEVNSNKLWKAKYSIGVSVQNTGGGEVSEIEHLSISVPDNKGIKVSEEITDTNTKNKNLEFVGPTTEIIEVRGQQVKVKKFSLSKSELDDFDSIDPSEHEVFYIPILVDDDFVGDSNFRSFLVKSEIRYKYKDSETTHATVKP